MSNDKLVRVSKDACSKYGLELVDVLGLIFIHLKGNYDEIIDKFSRAGIITPIYKGSDISGYSLMDEGISLIDSIMIDSVEKPTPDQRISMLAAKLKEVFPKGKKDGTIQYWRGNTPEIKNRLKSFFHRYGDFSDEEIINAAERYVKSFEEEGSCKNMRLLKYFIWKRESKFGEIEESSDLMAFIENEDSEENISNDWMSELK